MIRNKVEMYDILIRQANHFIAEYLNAMRKAIEDNKPELAECYTKLLNYYMGKRQEYINFRNLYME